MSFCIGYRSAIEYWNGAFRHVDAPLELGTSQSRRADTKAALASLERRDAARLPEGASPPSECTLPLHVMAASKDGAVRSADVVAHVRSAPLPSASLVRIDRDLFVSTPEFAFTQMADALSLVELIELGFELCGTYATGPDGTLRSDLPALSSVARLRRFLDRAPRFRGRRKAQRALRYVQDNSASPRETQLTMLLCLPYALGGYGLPRPELNRRVGLRDSRGRLSGAHCVCDLYWHDCRLDVEYDSTEFHAAPEALAKDARRRTALEAAKVTSINVTNAHMRDSGLFNQLARDVARILDKRLRYRDPQFTRAHLELRRQLGLP